jgi:hypothetical protein
MRIRSPGYPSINLQQAIDMVEKIFLASRQNAIDREAAAKDIGYSGLTGQSAKMLADLAHFGLIEKAGKGGLRVTDAAVRIIHPRSAAERMATLNEAAYSPALYSAIQKQWPDGFVSENALRGYLMRAGFSSAAVAPALSSFFETYRFLQQEGATESHGQAPVHAQNGPPELGRAATVSPDLSHEQPALMGPHAPQSWGGSGVRVMAGERVVFVDEVGQNYLKLIAAGEPDETMLEALEDYVKRQKKRLASAQQKQAN